MNAPHETDLTGKTYGRLTVLGPVITRNKRVAKWNCKCSCGNEKVVPALSLRHGRSVSCGCARRERIASIKYRHGMTGTRTHNIWKDMRKRCQNENSQFYRHYGGRGISVCDNWKSFEVFLADMGECPSDSHSIERIDVDGNYEPGNCTWILRHTQVLNRRCTLRVRIGGEMRPLALVCRERGLKYGFVYDRIKRLGWSVERAISEASHA